MHSACSSGSIPPSPDAIAVPAPLAPRASATFASSESAPKLMSETNTGMSSLSGRAAAGPITTDVSTPASSSNGNRCSCAVRICRSSQVGRSPRGTPIAATLPCGPDSPYLARPWISETNGSSAVSWCGSSKSRS